MSAEPMAQPAAALPVTLDNCDREPIHIPGSIQPHGVLLALDAQGRVRHVSANSALLADGDIAPGTLLQDTPLHAHDALWQLVQDGLRALASQDELPMPLECQLQGRTWDVVPHLSQGLLVLEFEERAADTGELSGFATRAHRAMERLRRTRPIDELLQLAADELRQLTGFDRVMAYRFRHDHSGDVVAEARAPQLDEYKGRRYPASDIPAQARRLYVANTLRLIADVRAAPVPLHSDGEAPLDLSASVLRSVSPIHIEYLSNMGVGASMSISLIVHGQLWGMLACHHMAPRQVPYSVRMACDVLAQLLGANIQGMLARSQTLRVGEMGALRARLIESTLHAEDEFAALVPFAAPLAQALRAEAAVVAEHGRLHCSGALPEGPARALLGWVEQTWGSPGHHQAPCHSDALPTLAPQLYPALLPWCGVLALPLDRAGGSWLLYLRREQVETIHWGGRPEKEIRPGPNGPRLTPRGSFELWKETVRGTAEHWSADDLELAQQLLDELVRAQHARHAELHRARTQLMAILGHDLRDPLHSISMAARVLEKAGDGSGRAGQIGQRIQSSSSRMQRLVSQVMDMSRLQARLGLDLQRAEVDLVPLLHDLMDEARTAHPGIAIEAQLPQALVAHADVDRVAQVFTNLLSNARHHGQAGQPLQVRAFQDAAGRHIQVRNVADAIPEAVVDSLFKPFKPTSTGNARNRSGLGLGLYIAQQIAQGHGGALSYRHEAPQVVFTLTLP